MTRFRFPFLTIAALAVTLAAPAASANDAPQGGQAQAALPKPTALRIGDLLSGELNALKTRARGKAGPVYQLVSDPRRLPAPSGLCNLENGPETFQIVPADEAQASQLKSHRGKQVALKVGSVACASEPGQISEAVVTKWSLVK
ncbi:hypothetical protein DU475_08935 [Rhodopseudomonas sp. WA056]|uniref:Uncharacterized protein n=1 Tax=Rhodopseudomonas palustris (strain DX-1) TaxID=652103 RepID=E6VMF3_RHOPX|nr:MULTISPECIES: hypothetical protein [Rhodopseudomonas]NEW87385.1 hypothetical protein [Rhodopseudomonas sp. WA056]QDL99356.1 hypothetical protein FLL57_19500 [Rhodopseudomonas palustris]